MAAEAAIAPIVALAIAVQRVTGLGFSQISAPLLVLVLGPVTGVLLANVLSLSTNVLVLAQTWRQVDVRRVVLLAVPALCLVPVGQAVTRLLPAPVLMVAIGSLVLLSLLALRLLRRSTIFGGVRGAIVAGAASGFMSVTAGVAGPALTLYAVGSQWPHRTFIGSAQLYFGIVNIASIAAKGVPDVSAGLLVVAYAALFAGLAAGHVVSRRVPPERARAAVVVLAGLGATATVVKGAMQAWGSP